MGISIIDADIINRINGGDEKAFSILYEAYYVYLNTVAIYYVPDANIGGEIVDDVFINLWNKKVTLSCPVHSFLVRSVQNGCLNYIRSQQVRQKIHRRHYEQLLSFQENHILSTSIPLQFTEARDMEHHISEAIAKLPPKTKAVFESWFNHGKSAGHIAGEMNISVNTVRVHLKKAVDKLKSSLNHLLLLLLFHSL